MKVLVTGGSGFIAAHCISSLLGHGHDVVLTVRSHAKGSMVVNRYIDLPPGRLSFFVVEDISQEGAFDQAVQSDPHFEGVLHTASPFHFDFTDVEKDMLKPAILGTTGILTSIMKYGPSVRRVVLTSSFAAMVNHGAHPAVYDESCWSTLRIEDAKKAPFAAYSASKALAERAAWDFMEQERPHFTLTTLTPPAVFGPIKHTSSLDTINISNTFTRDLIQGKFREGITASPIALWVDVRDLALAHVRALTRPLCGGKRVFVVAGFYRNAEIVDAVKSGYPELGDKLPQNYEYDPKSFDYGIDNTLSQSLLGLEYRSLKESVTDSVRVMLDLMHAEST